MSLKEIMDLAQVLFMLFIVMGGGAYLHKNLQKLASSQRNEHIKTALVVADQLVVSAEKALGNGKTQSIQAAQGMKTRLDEMGLRDFFTEEQIAQYIEYAYNKQVNEGVIKPEGKVEAEPLKVENEPV